MFDFLSSEVWWMAWWMEYGAMTIIISAIGAAIGLVIALIGVWLSNRKLGETLDTKRAELGTEHKDLSKEHIGLSKDQALIAKDVSVIIGGVGNLTAITTYLKEESLKGQARQEVRNKKEMDLAETLQHAATGNYNAVVNNAMMAMYEETGNPDFLGYAARNLDMMLTYIDPDDTIFTQNSTRQDQGKSDYPDKYFYQYLYLAALTQAEDSLYHRYHKRFDAAAHKIIKDNMERGDQAPECLHIIMAHPEMESYRFCGCGFLDTYRKYFEDAGVLRVRNERYCYSVLKGKSSFLFLKAGDTLVYMKIGESIGNCRNFTPDIMTVGEKECVLESDVSVSYYQPMALDGQKTYPFSSDWWSMDHTRREILTNSHLHMKVTIREEEDGLSLSVCTKGLTQVPIRLQFCIPAGAVVENDHFYLQAEKNQRMILRQGFVKIRHGQQTLELGPGFGTHEFGGHYSGEEENQAGYTIFMNDYSEFDREIKIKL